MSSLSNHIFPERWAVETCRVVADGVDDEDVGGEREDHQRRGEHHEEDLAH